MPLIILGAVVIIAIIIYWYVGNKNSDEPLDTREMRERYSRAVEDKAKDIAGKVGDDLRKTIRKRAGIFDVDYDIEDDGYGNKNESSGKSRSNDPEDNTIPFPSDVEREKRKRDIH